MSMRVRNGFTLVEMAIVLVIIGLLLGGMLMPLSAQMEQRQISETQKLLEDVNQALIGYAIANGRLPCPAILAANGQESFAGGGDASNGNCSAFDGLLPAVTLGLTGVDSNGFLRDAWQLSQNRIRYAVTSANGNAATTTDGIKTATMAVFNPDLYVCASATGINATTCGTATALSTGAVAVIYSLGKNAPSGGTGTDEAANLNGDAVFVSHTPTPAGVAGGPYDDIVVWLSPNTLFNRMLAAGNLP